MTTARELGDLGGVVTVTSGDVSLTGSLGLGTATPQFKLDVQGASGVGMRILETSTGNANRLHITQEAGVSTYNSTYSSGSTNGHAFQVGNSEAMRITGSYNVGIGTSTPGASGLTVYRSGGAAISLNNATTGTAAASGFQLQGGSGGDAYLWNYSNSFISIGTNNTERARIASTGDLLVGCTVKPSTGGAGSYGFAVEPNISVSGTSTLTWRSNTTVASDAFYFYTSAALVGFIRTSGSGTTYSTTSDYRLKENVQPMQNALATVAQLKPCTYTWKTDGTSGQGFIAHELQSVVPDCVTGEKDAVFEDGSIKPQGIDTSFLVATLTAAIQELRGIVDSQAARIAALEGSSNAPAPV
jgi:hypothetical protein